MRRGTRPSWPRRAGVAIRVLLPWGMLGLGCAASVPPVPPQPRVAAPSPGPLSRAEAPWRLDRSTFDPSADPCADFYRYVCGGFAVPASIPADRPSAEWAREAAARANDDALRRLLTGTDPAGDPDVRSLRAFFTSCMADGPAAHANAEATLARWMNRIEGVSRRTDVMPVVRELHARGVAAFFRYSGEPDRTDPTRYRGEIHQGTLGASRDAYADRSPGSEDRRRAYRAHVARMLELSGLSRERARRDAEAAIDVERRLAAASLSFAARFDPAVSEHPTTPRELARLAPHVGWAAYLTMVGHPSGRALNVTSPAYLATVDALLSRRPVPGLRAYLRWRFLDALGPALPTRLAGEHLRFGSVPGVERPPRFEECRLETLKALGVELSRQFSARFVGAQVRDAARAAAGRVREEIARSIQDLVWLSAGARASSEEKVRLLDLKIGFPDAWPETGSLPLRDDAFLENVLALQAFEQQRTWKRARAERRRESWEMTVYPNGAPGMAAARLAVANGFPDLFTNSLIVTAAALRSPLFEADAPPEVRYGALGTLVAHEVVHVLETHEVDGRGVLRDVWVQADVAARNARAECVVDQASEYVALEGIHLDGRSTVDENVADLGGVAHAYAAMVGELGARVHDPGADGWTPAQRFFVAYAQRWCAAERPESVRRSLREDPHAPPRFRVNAPLSNLPAFAEAFSCPQGAPMVRPRASRCAVW